MVYYNFVNCVCILLTGGDADLFLELELTPVLICLHWWEGMDNCFGKRMFDTWKRMFET